MTPAPEPVRRPTGNAPHPDKDHIGIGRAVSVVLSRRGWLAWIVSIRQNDLAPEATRYQVHALDSHGERTLAVSGVDPQSLALAGSTVYWAAGGQPFSTVLR